MQAVAGSATIRSLRNWRYMAANLRPEVVNHREAQPALP